uniref:Hypothetical capsid protein n=1 Tax=uncultured virus TaxID=340016 RepID=A0A1D8MK16_9VIRU|nr:hypothetical capsid protein [uncultured virus]AOV86284.1 hypothetical capsid protein [uncultured virus]
MASRSAYRSRSAFDDPTGADSAFNSGRAIGSYVRKRDFLEAFKDIAKTAIPDYWRQQKAKGIGQSPKRRKPVSVIPGAMVRYGKKRSRSASVGSSKRRKRSMSSGGRKAVRFSRSRSRSRPRSKSFRRRLKGMRKRFRARKRYVYSSKGKVRSFMRNIALNSCASPINLTTEYCFTLANLGTNLQNKCSWLAQQAVAPGVLDTVLAACSNDVITNVPPQYKGYLERVAMSMQLKNASNHRTDVTVYKLYARRDMPAGFADLLGLNPAFLQNAFTNVTQSASAARLKAYNEHGADPFESQLTSFFKIKKVLRKFMEPGDFFTIVQKVKHRVVSKAQFGIQITNSSIGSAWDHLKKFGPIILIRAQGPIVHDEVKGAPPVTDSVLNAYDVTAGSYAVDIFFKRHYRLWGSDVVASTNVPAYGMTTLALPNAITLANEKTYEAVRPDDDQPAY